MAVPDLSTSTELPAAGDAPAAASEPPAATTANPADAGEPPAAATARPAALSEPPASATRERIVRATLHLIGEHGIGALSNRRIANEAGVALGSLTYHFPSQTELLRESLLLYVQEEAARVATITDELRQIRLTPAEVAAEVERIVERSTDRIEQVAELELHLHAARDPALQDASERCFAAYEALATVALQALGIPGPERHARTVVAVMYGLALRRLGTGERDAAGTADALITIMRGAAGGT